MDVLKEWRLVVIMAEEEEIFYKFLWEIRGFWWR